MECAVCFEEIKSDALTVACGHKFHSCCMKTWKQHSKTCPLCRYDLDVGEDMFEMQYMPDDLLESWSIFFGLPKRV